MQDSIASYVLERSGSGVEGNPVTGDLGTLTGDISSISPSPSADVLLYDDPAQPNPYYFYRLTGTTVGGDSVPFNVVKIAVPADPGTLTFFFDAANNAVTFVWPDPPPTLGGFSLSYFKFEFLDPSLPDADENWSWVDLLTSDQRGVTVAAFPGSYRLTIAYL